jgi:alpha-aminoadipic semialdehyde synthase
MTVIGIRSEKGKAGERRVPLIPQDVAALIRDHNLRFVVESSDTRIHPDGEYAHAGAEIAEDLSSCDIIVGVKEVPAERLLPKRTYVFFSHTIKGQPYNMPLLRRVLDTGCNLLDYELMTDEDGRRTIAFGRHAGLAGAVETLWALGQRLEWEGIKTPLARVRRPAEYGGLAAAREAIALVGEEIWSDGFPAAATPVVIGVAGYGLVSSGAQEILDLLPVTETTAEELPDAVKDTNPNSLVKVVFREEDLVVRKKGGEPFDLQEYYRHPDRYRSRFEDHAVHLTALINCIYWDARYPRLVTLDFLRRAWADGARPNLRVMGDISCDIDGSVECTVRATDPANPVYVYDPATHTTTDGLEGNGPVVLAVDILPAEIPADSSRHFSSLLAPLIPGLAGADAEQGPDAPGLPGELRRAFIASRGRLVPPWDERLREALELHGSGAAGATEES